MNRKKKSFVLCIAAGVIALLLLLFCIWYSWPRPIAVLGVNETNTEGIDCLAMESGVRGRDTDNRYLSASDEGMGRDTGHDGAVKKQLLFPIDKNLLPKAAGSLGSENGNGDLLTVSITLLYKNGSDNFLFLDNGNGRLMKQDGQLRFILKQTKNWQKSWPVT